ncbi:MAG TPA: hypothetical protein VFO10_02790 [Oligoflexus sp.]|uniref:hypothetical protein n=1 Tax=Oligoflexus sp. TaxID=1971216 RepID=UPI002D7EDEFA|nr:hypothetical protein [Oligoflexus sp.]HET9236149.1 hypothetical protein [Oligoflexus sp.]
MLRVSLCTILLATVSTSALAALNLRTERNALCGVELYEERYDGDVCGWVYYEKQTNACELDRYEEGADLSCPGSDLGGRKITAELTKQASGGWSIAWWSLKGGSTVQGSEDIQKILGNTLPDLNPGNDKRETAFWSCKFSYVNTMGSSWYGGLSCTAKPFAATCAMEKFGKVYKPCRAESHGKESPKKCRSEEFDAELHNSCSFYKTPEEIDAFIDATYGSLAINSVSLPSKQADLYGSFRQEASFICLIEKYKDLEGYDDVFNDLVVKFKNAFSYDYAESSRTCAESANEAVPPKITAGDLDCKTYTVQTIKTLTKPESMNPAVFNRFKSTCSVKLAYDFAVSWFDDKLVEINQLLGDVVAKEDAERKQYLDGLKQSVLESKQ